MPDLIIGFRSEEENPIGWTTSPFFGTRDLYQLRDLPVRDSPVWPHDLTIYAVEGRIPGKVLTSVERRGA